MKKLEGIPTPARKSASPEEGIEQLSPFKQRQQYAKLGYAIISDFQRHGVKKADTEFLFERLSPPVPESDEKILVGKLYMYSRPYILRTLRAYEAELVRRRKNKEGRASDIDGQLLKVRAHADFLDRVLRQEKPEENEG